jgi:hypothetical protein
VALLAAEDVVALEVDVVNPDALLNVDVVLEEREIVELELLLLAVEEGVVPELLAVLELIAVEEDAVLEVGSADEDAMLDEDVLLEERGVEELELLTVEEDAVLEAESADVEETAGAEDVLVDVVA